MYKILTSNNASKLEESVEYYLKTGWKLAGGVSVAVHEHRDKIFAQAITR